MNDRKLLAVLALMFFMAVSLLIAVPPAKSMDTPLAGDAYQHGPRTENLQINFYADVEGAYGALVACDIDAIWYDITFEQYLYACDNPNIQLAAVDDMGMYEIDINNNYSCPTEKRDMGGFVRNPCNEREFRLAMSLLVDKDYVVATCCGGFAARIDIAVAAPCGEEWKHPNRSTWLSSQYNPILAQTTLDNAGFVVGATPNPEYDATIPWSQPFTRTYPVGWDGFATSDLFGGWGKGLYAAIRSDDARRQCAGIHLARNLELSGIPVNQALNTMAGHYGRVMGSMDYHFYTGGWSLGRFPLNQRDFYHSDFWYSYGPNYITGLNQTGDPNYPFLDPYLEDIYYCTDIPTSQAASQDAQEIYMRDLVINIPLYGARAFWAYKDLIGVTNMDGYSLDNLYTFVNMYKAGGGIPTIGLITPPYQLNVEFSSWFYDRQVMDVCYGAAAGISLAPYNLGRDQPWVIQDWTPTTWIDPQDDVEKSKVVVWFRENVKWIMPVTGCVLDSFTAHDFVFSKRFHAAFEDAWTYDDTVDIHHMKIIDDYCVEIYFHTSSYWLQYIGDYVLHKETWETKFCSINVTTVPNVTPVFCSKLNLTEYMTDPHQQILQVIDCTHDGVTLIEDVDYRVVMIDHRSAYIHWLANRTIGTFVITYWTPDLDVCDPHGYYPGDPTYDWSDFPGIGLFYLVAYDKTVGASLKANRHFFLETPVPDPKQPVEERCDPLPGEVDWIWYWGQRDETRPAPNDPRGPRTGYYEIDISDVVLCTAAWKRYGTACPPDPKWFSGADLAPPACFIDIGDVVTITGRYRRKFGGWSDFLPCEPWPDPEYCP